jgi:tetratricopeptide (TPR) repeat protein
MTTLLIIYVWGYAWTYFSIFCHEMGHFTFGKLAGMSPYLVTIGTGKKLLRLRLLNAVFEFRHFPYGGITHAYHLTFDGMRLRYMFFLIGGVFTNFILLLLLINLLTIQNTLIIWVSIIIEVISLFNNLIPRELKIYEKNLHNDGKQIILALTTNYNKILKDVFEQYTKQLCRYKNTEEISPKTFLGNDVRTLQIFLEAETKLHTYHAFEEAVELFLEVLKFKNISNSEKAFILDALACIVAMNGYKEYLNEADKWSQEAIELASQSQTLKGTRGAILIELGRYDEGKQLLLPLTEPENEDLDIAVSSCYIAKAEYFLGNIDRVNAWLVKAKKIDNTSANSVLKRIQEEINYYV